MSRAVPRWLAVLFLVTFLRQGVGAFGQQPHLTATSSGKQSCSDWSDRFEAIDDATVLQTLREHRETGWDAVIKSGEKLGISLEEQIADGERQLNTSRAAEARARNGLSSRRKSATDRTAPPDCSNPSERERNLTCQARVRHNEVLALEGVLDLLRCRIPAHPSAPYRPEGTPIATFAITVVPSTHKVGGDTDAADCPCDEQKAYSHARTLSMEQNGKTIEVEQGSYIVLRFDPKDNAAGFTLEPDQGVLQFNTEDAHFPRDTIGILKAKAPGHSKIIVFARSEPNAANEKKERPSGSVMFAGSTSSNWAGYILTGGPFEFIRGEWNVPTIDSTVAGDMAEWVGIDGFSNSSLIQAGTYDGYSGGFLGFGAGSAHSAWVEILPAKPAFLPNPVFAGDNIVVTISPLPGMTVAPSSTNSWVISIKNTTEGWTFSTLANFNGPLTSAEWIVEDPRRCFISCWLDPLPGFGTVSFDLSNAVATGASPPAVPVFTAAESEAMVQGGVTMVSPSLPDCDMDGFSVAAGATPPGPPGPFFTNGSLPGGIEGVPYKTRLFVSGLVGLAPFSEGITVKQGSTPLPPGLSLNEGNGEITGIPTTTGTFPFTAQVDDVGTIDDFGAMASCTAPMSITIFPNFVKRPRCIFSKRDQGLICF